MEVVGATAEAVDVHTKFVAESSASKEALKSAYLLQKLNINVLICGDKGTGKLPLALIILPDAVIVDYRDIDKLIIAIKQNKELIITNFSDENRYSKSYNLLDSINNRVIFISRILVALNSANIGITINLIPLSQRSEDMILLRKNYTEEAKNIFSDNFKKDIYISHLAKVMNREDMLTILESFFYNNISRADNYRQSLKLFDKALIKAWIKKVKSQLQVAKHLGINRNTLRKKMEELEI